MSIQNINTEAGLRKKSFELYFNGGSIWAEHLDGMGDMKEKVIEKFQSDKKSFCRPSMTSFIIVNLDQTEIDDDIISCIFDTFVNSQKRFMKIAFVGVKKIGDRNYLRDISRKKGCPVEFFDDFEKAKWWVLP
ncbi:MAG: hypothetical protein ACI4RH_05580 [Huintestinicola sp.]